MKQHILKWQNLVLTLQMSQLLNACSSWSNKDYCHLDADCLLFTFNSHKEYFTSFHVCAAIDQVSLVSLQGEVDHESKTFKVLPTKI